MESHKSSPKQPRYGTNLSVTLLPCTALPTVPQLSPMSLSSPQCPSALPNVPQPSPMSLSSPHCPSARLCLPQMHHLPGKRSDVRRRTVVRLNGQRRKDEKGLMKGHGWGVGTAGALALVWHPARQSHRCWHLFAVAASAAATAAAAGRSHTAFVSPFRV